MVGSLCPLVYAGVATVSILVKGQVEDVSYAMVSKGDTLQTVMNVFSGGLVVRSEGRGCGV